MKIKVLFFGPTADATGTRSVMRDVPIGIKSSKLLDQVLVDFPELGRHRLLFSLNQQYATGDEVIRDGDELAIFTAVSGG